MSPPEGPLQARTSGSPTLCVVVPVLNESGNVAELVDRLRSTLVGCAWEVMFVDDNSSDGTRERIAEIGAMDARVRLVHRTGRRGLSSAFIEGASASLAPYIAAMDGDLQHDETLLPRMLAVLQSEDVDVVVGSRYVDGGGLGEWDASRARMSGLATRMAHRATRTDVRDPMSGLFMLPRAVFERARPRLSAIGFKILLDILASLPEPPRVRELPFQFRTRVAGESKLDSGVIFDYGVLLLDKLFGTVVPVRFAIFALIGGLGLVLHLVVLRLFLALHLGFEASQALATGIAIAANFVLNNVITFRDQKLRGPRVLPGFIVFAAVCAVGALANINIAQLMLHERQTWWAAGIVGAAMSLVWNYAVGSSLTWRRR